MTYDPQEHRRRSIRMGAHDYARGGTYFVTVCAARDAGPIFAQPDVRAMVGRMWEKALVMAKEGRVAAVIGAAEEGTHGGREDVYCVMPDHFHGIIRIPRPSAPRVGASLVGALPDLPEDGVPWPPQKALGQIIGAFKSLVTHEYIQRVKAGEWPRFRGKIWHRNFYETIIRSPEHLANVSRYIRTNPWRIVQRFDGMRGIGNPSLWHARKTGLLCSRICPTAVLAAAIDRAHRMGLSHCVLGGFHSPPEREILAALLRSEARLICCPSWGIDQMRIPPEWLPVLEQNRMLILEMSDTAATLTAAEERNRFVIEAADTLWVPHRTPGGMIDRVIRETRP